MAKIEIISVNKYNEIEWIEAIESNTIRGTKAKATKWLQNNLFENDYANIEKRTNQFTNELSEWVLRS